MTSMWFEHVRKMAKEKGLTFSEAMKDPSVKSSYKKTEKKEGDKLEIEKVKKTLTRKPRLKKTAEEMEKAKENKKEKKLHEKKEEAMGQAGNYSAGAVKNPGKLHKNIKLGKTGGECACHKKKNK